MRLLLLGVLIVCSFSCSSDKNSDEEYHALALPYKYKSRVEIEDEKGNMKPVVTPGSKNVTVIDPLTGKKFQTKGWIDPTKDNLTPGSHLKKLNFDQLYEKAGKCTPSEAILIVDEIRSRKSELGVKTLARFLSDSRVGVFSNKRKYWWYEKKGDYEELEIRTYAAFALQNHTKGAPYGVVIVMNHDKKLLYAVRDKFAVVKDDVNKVWKAWWLSSRKDYE